MYKPIPGNRECRIDINGNVITFKNEPYNNTAQGLNNINIELFGKMTKISIQKLICHSWYEIDSIANLESHISKINYSVQKSNILKIECGYIQWFSEPIEYIPGFRIIPSYCRYAIDIGGNVLDTQSNELVDKKMVDTSGYPSVYIYTPNKSANRWVRLHRLIALAWVPNKDFTAKPYINHINGNKEDHSLINLEWCSLSENSTHAYDTSLNTCNIPVKVRDVRTTEVTVYLSLARALADIGSNRGYSVESIRNKLPGYLYKNRYEIKALDDDSPWFYPDTPDDDLVTRRHYDIEVHDKATGITTKYPNLKTLIKKCKVRLVSDNLSNAALEIQKKYPNLTVSYKRHCLKGPYYAFNLKTNEILTGTSLKSIAAMVGVGFNMVQLDLTRKKKFIYNHTWVITTEFKKPDLSEYSIRPETYSKIEVTNTESGVIEIYDSIAKAAKALGAQDGTISKCIKTGRGYKVFKFRALSQ